MTSARRAREVARPRQVAMYLSKQLTPKSLPDIGRRFGGRDHTTVIHAVRQIEKLRASDAELDALAATAPAGADGVTFVPALAGVPAFAFASMLLSHPVRAQREASPIAGRAIDSAGAPVPGIRVHLTEAGHPAQVLAVRFAKDARQLRFD